MVGGELGSIVQTSCAIGFSEDVATETLGLGVQRRQRQSVQMLLSCFVLGRGEIVSETIK